MGFWLLIALCLFGTMTISPGRLQAQSTTQPTLSGDLLFSTGQLNANGLPASHNVLAQLDLKTGQATTWYSDPSAVYLKALSWSPQGSLLAFLRVEYVGGHYVGHLCLLNRAGERQSCTEDMPVNYASVYNDYQVAWSDDGSRIYLVSGDDKTWHLIEADASTGKTLRTLYEYTVQANEHDIPPFMAWTNDLSSMTIGAGDKTRVERGLPVLLVNLKTQAQIDLGHIQGAVGSSPFVMCPFFSPQGSYLTAYNFDVPETPAIPQFLVLDKQGKIVSIVKPSAPFNALPQGCPAWQQDELAFYFDVSQGTRQSSSLIILKYTLKTQQFTVYYQSGPLNDLAEATLNSRLSLSPDGSRLAFESPFDPGVSLGSQVAVASSGGSDGTLQRYSTPFRFASDPLWIPAG